MFVIKSAVRSNNVRSKIPSALVWEENVDGLRFYEHDPRNSRSTLRGGDTDKASG